MLSILSESADMQFSINRNGYFYKLASLTSKLLHTHTKHLTEHACNHSSINNILLPSAINLSITACLNCIYPGNIFSWSICAWVCVWKYKRMYGSEGDLQSASARNRKLRRSRPGLAKCIMGYVDTCMLYPPWAHCLTVQQDDRSRPSQPGEK